MLELPKEKTMKPAIVSFVCVAILLVTAYVSYRFGQSDGYEMGFTGGLHANMKTIYDTRLNKDGVFTITKRELEKTLRGTQSLMDLSGASTFVSWKWKRNMTQDEWNAANK